LFPVQGEFGSAVTLRVMYFEGLKEEGRGELSVVEAVGCDGVWVDVGGVYDISIC
jgi:hypothetical protein